MKTSIIRKTKELLIVTWEKEEVGFGHLTMKWNQKLRRFILDAEYMNTDTVIEIFKAIK